MGNKGISEPTKGNVQCWVCKGPHYFIDFPSKNSIQKKIHNMEDNTIVNDLAKTPRIYATFENRQANYQPLVAQVEGMISRKPIYVLIYYGSILSYVCPKIVDQCKLRKLNMYNHGWFNY